MGAMPPASSHPGVKGPCAQVSIARHDDVHQLHSRRRVHQGGQADGRLGRTPGALTSTVDRQALLLTQALPDALPGVLRGGGHPSRVRETRWRRWMTPSSSPDARGPPQSSPGGRDPDTDASHRWIPHASWSCTRCLGDVAAQDVLVEVQAALRAWRQCARRRRTISPRSSGPRGRRVALRPHASYSP